MSGDEQQASGDGGREGESGVPRKDVVGTDKYDESALVRLGNSEDKKELELDRTHCRLDRSKGRGISERAIGELSTDNVIGLEEERRGGAGEFAVASGKCFLLFQ